MKFGKEKEAEIVKALASKSQYKVGLDYGFDKVYSTPRQVRNAVTTIYNKVKNNPEEYGLTQEVLDVIAKGMQERAISFRPNEQTLAEKNEDTRDIKTLINDIRDKTFKLIDKKLDVVSNSRKKMNALSFKDLGIIAGISFDKSQILKGEATENIAVHAKISKDMDPDEALRMALEMREKKIEQKNDK